MPYYMRAIKLLEPLTKSQSRQWSHQRHSLPPVCAIITGNSSTYQSGPLVSTDCEGLVGSEISYVYKNNVRSITKHCCLIANDDFVHHPVRQYTIGNIHYVVRLPTCFGSRFERNESEYREIVTLIISPLHISFVMLI